MNVNEFGLNIRYKITDTSDDELARGDGTRDRRLLMKLSGGVALQPVTWVPGVPWWVFRCQSRS